MQTSSNTRRHFLQTGGAGLSMSLMPSAVRGANDRLNIGVIGAGHRGTLLVKQLLKLKADLGMIEIVRVCDVYRKRTREAEELTGAQGCTDYTDVLADPAVDAVIIATPDHWHARMAIEACEAGKDVYLEKPMTKTIAEAKAVWQTVERTGRILQVGSQHASTDTWWQARKAIQAGVIGKLILSLGSANRNSIEGEWNYPIDQAAGPTGVGDDYIDWKSWIGPAEDRPFDADRFFRFRKYWDYSGGIATDLFYHRLVMMTIAWGGGQFPYRATGSGGVFVFHDREVPDTFTMTDDYPAGHHVCMFSSMANDYGSPILLRGHEGTINNRLVTPQRVFAEGFRDRCEAAGLTGEWREKHIEARSRRYTIPELLLPEEERPTHMENFLNCVQTRNTPVLDALTGFQVMTAVALSVEAYRAGATMYFDEKSLTMTTTLVSPSSTEL